MLQPITTQYRISMHERYIAVENVVREGEIACNKQFLLFSQCFLPFMALHFKMSSAICFNLNQSKILLSGSKILLSGYGLRNGLIRKSLCADALTLYHTIRTFNAPKEAGLGKHCLTTLKKTPFKNIVGKGENAGDQHFLLFPQCFQPFLKPSFDFFFYPNLLSLLQVLSISTSLKFCCLVRR